MERHNQENALHVPVLLEEVLQYLGPKAGDSYLDLTAGYGGHASAVLATAQSQTPSDPSRAVLVDRDASAVHELTARFGGSATIIQADFAAATEQLLAMGRGSQFDMILADLGVSSPHLDQAARGFSLAMDGPLDMRMDQDQELTADRIVNGYPEDRLATILAEYGEEPKSRAIAHAIVMARPVRSTKELAAIAARQWHSPNKPRSKVHPATRTFQAIRIAVNDELGLLEKALPQWINLLKPGGRICIISFQSLEDRLVKKLLADASGDRYDSELTLLTKRPITASHSELVHNPRARSAKLRAAVKINN
jgi:16S rRNA (cytosine1402-N4)-methyltransferase